MNHWLTHQPVRQYIFFILSSQIICLMRHDASVISLTIKLRSNVLACSELAQLYMTITSWVVTVHDKTQGQICYLTYPFNQVCPGMQEFSYHYIYIQAFRWLLAWNGCIEDQNSGTQQNCYGWITYRSNHNILTVKIKLYYSTSLV